MDENGKVDSYEFICGLALLSESSVEEKAELLFNLYDFDGNKFITRDELVILMTNTLASINAYDITSLN
jgi:Ca2+-binding EF-hand superfamily protein